MFRTYGGDAVGAAFFRAFFLASAGSSAIVLGGLSQATPWGAVAGAELFLGTTALLSLSRRFRRSSFGLLLCFFTVVHFTLPLAFVFSLGPEYGFGSGLASLPAAPEEYWRSLGSSLVFLTLCWGSLWFGIVLASAPPRPIEWVRLSRIRLWTLVVLGAVVAAITWVDNHAFIQVRLGGEARPTSALVFLFFDHAFLVLAGMVLVHHMSRLHRRGDMRRGVAVTGALFVCFSVVLFAAGSKGALLTAFKLLILLPLSEARGFARSRVPFLKPGAMAALLVLMPPLFYLALMQRMALATGVTPDGGSLASAMAAVDRRIVDQVFQDIMYRISAGGVDRYHLVFHSFVAEGWDPRTAVEFATYTLKNGLNLVLPGSPFPEAYSPTSQLMPQVLAKSLQGVDYDAGALIRALNTQPYTVFGVFLILTGSLAPLLLFLVVLSYAKLHGFLRGAVPRATSLYFFNTALSSYGLEVSFGNAVHLGVSMLLMSQMLRWGSRLDVAGAWKGVGIASAIGAEPIALPREAGLLGSVQA